MVNPLYSFNYIPLISGSGGQDSLYIRSIRVQKNTIRMVNPLYSFNYFPLVSGSGGQDSLDSSNSCSKKTHPHGKIRYSRYYFPLVSGSTTIGASLIVSISLLV